MEYLGFLKRLTAVIAAVLLIGQTGLYAQDYDAIERHINREEFADANQLIRQGLGAEPKDERLHYLDGLMNFRQENYTAAKQAFNKGKGYGGRYPNNYIGLGACMVVDGNFSGAKENLEEAKELNKKNETEILNLIGQAWLGSDGKEFLAEAEKMFYKVTALDPQNAEAFIGLGDLYDRQNVDELALNNYEKAIEIRPDFIKGWLRVGQIKKKMKDYQGAAEAFSKAIEVDPSFPPAYKEMAEMWILAGQVQKANENYEKYLEMVNNDLYARMRYATIQYLGQQYEKAAELLDDVMEDTTTTVLLRIAFYVHTELGNADKADNFRKKYFAEVPEKSILPNDYRYEGKLLQLRGNIDEAVAKYEKAAELSAENGNPKPEYYEEISDIYKDEKNYEKQAEYLAKYMGMEGVRLKLSMVFGLGRAYYFAGNDVMNGDSAKGIEADTVKAMGLFQLADSTFGKMIEYKEDLHIGWAWRGRSNAKMDPGSTEGKAMPYYQKVLELIGDDEDLKAKYKNDFIEAHRYLGAYFTLVKEDCETALIHWNAIQEIDPENQQAKDAIEFCQ